MVITPPLRARADCLASKIGEHVPGELLVKLRPGAAVSDVTQEYDSVVLEQVADGLVLVKLPPGMSTPEGIAVLGEDPRVEYADANDIVTGTVKPNDLGTALWGLEKVQLPAAWDVQTGRRDGPVIAVIDSGVDYRHPDLQANAWTNPRELADGKDNDGNGIVDDLHGYNAIANSGDPMDDNHHGTHCAGTIAGEGNNGQGVAGVNWQGRLLGAKFLGANGKGTMADAVKAINYATAQGARIANHSWSSEGGWGNKALEEALRNSPALHLAAAGNEGRDIDQKPCYPAAFDLPNVITVAATDASDALASFSNYGAVAVDLAAPGTSIYSTLPNGQYGYLDGTSMATPHVAGVAGLIATEYPGISNADLRARLLASVDLVPGLKGMTVTGGRLNAAKAIEDDRVPPGPVGNFRGSAAPTGEVTLAWTASGDDGAAGRASSYDLREGGHAVAIGAPAPAGQPDGATLLTFPAEKERKLDFTLQGVDNVGLRSPARTASVTVPATPVAFDDDHDSLFSRWTGEGTWARTSVEGRGKVWADSPDGQYENGANRSLTSPEIALGRGSFVTFDCRHDLENRFDKVHLEVSRDGQTWASLQEFTGSKAWSRSRVDLSAHDGQRVRLRFRLETDNAVARDGFCLDRLAVGGL